MISRITGTVINKGKDYIVVDINVLCLKVFVPDPSEYSNDVELETYLVVREMALDLYGFNSDNDRKYFELLLTIPGIGPKTALALILNVPVHDVSIMIKNDDTDELESKLGKNGDKVIRKFKIVFKELCC